MWVAVGGRGTLLGPILGAFGVNAFKSWATRAYPDLWQILLGALFVLVTLFMPKGLVGLPEQLRGLKKRYDLRRKKITNEAAAAISPAVGELGSETRGRDARATIAETE